MYQSIMGPAICRLNLGSHWRDERVREVFDNSQFEEEVTKIARPYLDASCLVTSQIGFTSCFVYDYIDFAFDSIL